MTWDELHWRWLDAAWWAEITAIGWQRGGSDRERAEQDALMRSTRRRHRVRG